MIIVRDGKEIELTRDEVSQAHKEFVINWMTGVLRSEYCFSESDIDKVANEAYDIYCKKEGYSELDGVEEAASHFS